MFNIYVRNYAVWIAHLVAYETGMTFGSVQRLYYRILLKTIMSKLIDNKSMNSVIIKISG
jgi:hypothetical protein